MKKIDFNQIFGLFDKNSRFSNIDSPIKKNTYQKFLLFLSLFLACNLISRGQFTVYQTWDFENRSVGTYTDAMALEDFDIATRNGIPHSWFWLHGDHSRITSDVINGVTTKVAESIVPTDNPFDGFQIEAYLDTSVIQFQELYISYNLKFSANELLSSNKGKLIGLRALPEADKNSDGYMAHGEGFYCCPMFQANQVIAYHYDWTVDRQGNEPDYGYLPWSDETMDCNPTYFSAGVWYNITQRIVLNSFTDGVPNADGIEEIWINGVQIFHENYLILVADQGKCINGVSAALYTNYTTANETNFRFDNMVTWVNVNDPTYGTRNLHNSASILATPIDPVTDPVVTITATDASATEQGETTGTYTISRGTATSGNLTVNYATPTGTATLTTDYTLSTSGSVTIADGNTSATVTVTPDDDASGEGSETVILTLTTGAGYTIGSPSSATITITDNDDVTNVALNKTATQSSTAYSGVASRGVDGNTSGLWANNFVTHTNSDMNAWWEVDLGQVYNISSIQVWNRTDGCCMARMDNFYVFLANSFTSQDLTTTLNQSGIWKSSQQTTYPNPSYTCNPGTSGRYVRVQLGDQAELNIAEVIVMGSSASLPTVTIAATDAAAGEAATPNTGTFTVSRTGSTTAALTVNFSAPTGTATLTTDYTLSPSGSVSIPIGSSTATVTVTPVDDAAVESSETVILTLDTGTGYTIGSPSAATVTIADNDFTNVALNKTATQSSTAYSAVASRGVDGNTSGLWANNSVTHTNSDMNAWWQVDLGEDYQISSIQVWNRTDACCMARMDNFYVFLADAFTSYDLTTTINQSGMWYVHQTTYPNPSYTCYPDTEGRYVRVQLGDQAELNIAEVIVTGYSLKSAVINSGNEVTLTKEQNKSRIKVFPNPGSTTITVSGFSKALELRILDVLGKDVYRVENISNSAEVDVSNFRKGMYLIILKEGNNHHLTKFMKD
ncbi:MAG: hypothetical protein A2W90_22000 [Bacteroidetes bacterium GWF2_42_66]|nr:MAG: hypothetical protein A2W92_04815 [Bacteroidetes bacterium GWA2_42_15]OFY03239.1 MAG: hypothetical protein A2W89_18860 [Bacteroidetes bacterium GWE2_42_39]OFY45711.1 MAG: hypothetical protein A2W90_22000 [Bacteroidetes bacterium GWF2_42_66]HBL77296.1 hypothetical protein [Prolixibacteraceae bacterium]HCU62454.1 hypothetical protein [Prolixibacteraceae bacterium]